MGQCKQDHHEILSSEYAIATRVLSINVFIPVQRGQTANCCCSKYLKSQLFINRMPKMCAIPQFVLAPLNPIPRNMQNILEGVAHNVSTVTDFHILLIYRQVQVSIYRALSLNLDCMIMYDNLWYISFNFLRWLDTVFQVQYLPSLSINYVAINTDLEKLPPQLYQIKMKICQDQGCNDIGVVIATK